MNLPTVVQKNYTTCVQFYADTYKIYVLPQVWNEIVADNQHNLGKLGTVKVHSYSGQLIVMFTRS